MLLVLTMLMPALALMATLVVAAYSLWLLVNFLDVAHRLGSLGKSVLVLVFSVVGVTIGLSFLMMLIGVPATEAS